MDFAALLQGLLLQSGGWSGTAKGWEEPAPYPPQISVAALSIILIAAAAIVVIFLYRNRRGA